jgi:hypothetical protein
MRISQHTTSLDLGFRRSTISRPVSPVTLPPRPPPCCTIRQSTRFHLLTLSLRPPCFATTTSYNIPCTCSTLSLLNSENLVHSDTRFSDPRLGFLTHSGPSLSCHHIFNRIVGESMRLSTHSTGMPKTSIPSIRVSSSSP